MVLEWAQVHAGETGVEGCSTGSVLRSSSVQFFDPQLGATEP